MKKKKRQVRATWDGAGGRGGSGREVGCGGKEGSKPLTRKVDIRLPGTGNSNSHGARPVHQIIAMIKWIRTSRLSIKNSLSLRVTWDGAGGRGGSGGEVGSRGTEGSSQFKNNYFAEL